MFTAEEKRIGLLNIYNATLKQWEWVNPLQILSMHDHALQGIYDLSDEGIKNYKEKARKMQIHLNRKQKQKP